MAVNKHIYRGNVEDSKAKPLIKLVKFAAGSSQAVKQGELLELSGGNFAPLSSDKAMSGIVAVSIKELTSSHLAGYYPVIIPRPGDLFELDLASATAAALGASLYVSDSQTLKTSGSNELGKVFDHAGIPREQGNADVGDVADRGTTITAVSTVLFTITKANSYYAALQG